MISVFAMISMIGQFLLCRHDKEFLKIIHYSWTDLGLHWPYVRLWNYSFDFKAEPFPFCEPFIKFFCFIPGNDLFWVWLQDAGFKFINTCDAPVTYGRETIAQKKHKSNIVVERDHPHLWRVEHCHSDCRRPLSSCSPTIFNVFDILMPHHL